MAYQRVKKAILQTSQSFVKNFFDLCRCEQSIAPIIAISCYWIWLYVIYSLDVFVMLPNTCVHFDIVQKGFGFLGATLFMVSMSQFHLKTSRSRYFNALSLFSFGSGMLAVIISMIAKAKVFVFVPVVLTTWLLMGAGTSAAFLRLFNSFQNMNQKQFCNINVLALFLSGIFYLIVLGLQQDIQLILTIFIICCAAFMPLQTALKPNSEDNLEDTTSFSKSCEIKKDKLIKAMLDFRGELFLLSIVFGVTYCLGISLSIMINNLKFIWLSLCMPGICLILYNVFFEDCVSIRTLLVLIFPIVTFLLLLLPFSNEFGVVLYCSLLIVCFTIYDVLNIVRLNNIIITNKLSRNKSWTISRYSQLAGLTCGWAIGYGILFFDSLLPISLSAVCAVFIIAIVIMLTRYTHRLSNENIKVSTLQETADHAYDVIALRYGLSPRECEIMKLVVRGYSIERIRKDLNISYYTAKTHIYHIYQKMDVHAKQELIDLVESRLRLM